MGVSPSLSDLPGIIISCPCWESNPDLRVVHIAKMLTELRRLSGINSESYEGRTESHEQQFFVK